MPDPPPAFAALIPAFDCAATIAAVVAGARRHVEPVVVVDDGSRDGTGAEAARAGARVVTRRENGGKGAAIRTGLEGLLASPRTSHVVFLDGDGQHDPEEIPKFVEAAARGEGFVIGSRMAERDSIPGYRYETNRIGDMILSRMTGHAVEDGQSGFRAVSSELLRRLSLRANGYLVETEMLLKAAPFVRRFATVPIRAIYGGPSHYRPFRDTWKISWGAVFIKVFET
ncbi:MAG TPA: glycosyltransferase family 2 protein [Thermoanaerobaculia bacterium]|nr:glycosyltransferase family 2 protein [Thermoanaerobaculia bacterium]